MVDPFVTGTSAAVGVATARRLAACSGNVAAYGGYVKAKDFGKHGGVAGGAPPTPMLALDGGCSTSSLTNEPKEVVDTQKK